jgi:protein-tyrosine-phosphatase
MGEAILKQLVAVRLDADEWRIESAGTWALLGSAPAPLSQLVMQTRGMDISHHQSQPVTEELIQQFDLVLTMESNHKESLQLVFKDRADRIFMISEVVGQREDISDPIGGELEDYHETADRLEKILSHGLDRIIQLVKGHE